MSTAGMHRRPFEGGSTSSFFFFFFSEKKNYSKRVSLPNKKNNIEIHDRETFPSIALYNWSVRVSQDLLYARNDLLFDIRTCYLIETY